MADEMDLEEDVEIGDEEGGFDDEFADDTLEDDEVVDEVVDEVEDDEVAAEPVTPRARKRAGDDDEEEEDDEDPDDVEADLDTILKDRIASGDDLDDEEEEETPDRSDPDSGDGIVQKKEGEFTCSYCFMIVHPRQFGRKDRPTCPEGYDECPSLTVVGTH